ncbi:MAG TPA: heat-inducible transcriptional repressor HrcA [Acidobacteriaceae bacterium]
MSPGPRITPRERLVLLSIVESYIATGEPVASQTVARHFAHAEGMSAATIRNVMASLGDSGLLDQQHSSAGRIPTPLAFRVYVDSLGTEGLGWSESGGQSQPGAHALSPQQREHIEGSFAGVNSSQQFMERTSHVLASISTGLGIALLSAQEAHALEHIHFSRLGAGRVLAVVVTEGGVVLDRVLVLDRELASSELDASARYLNENFRGWSIDRIRTELARRLDEERSEYDRLMRSLEELCDKGALADSAGAATLYIGGVANLLASPLDRELLRQMLAALETRERLIALLNAYVDARQQTVRVVVGLEDTMPEMGNFVLVGAPTRLGLHRTGTVAVIAPTRMQYQETIGAVSFIAQLSGRLLQGPQ